MQFVSLRRDDLHLPLLRYVAGNRKDPDNAMASPERRQSNQPGADRAIFMGHAQFTRLWLALGRAVEFCSEIVGVFGNNERREIATVQLGAAIASHLAGLLVQPIETTVQ